MKECLLWKLSNKSGKAEIQVIEVSHKTPNINTSATSIRGLINWNVDVHEPVFTSQMSTTELKNIKEIPMKTPNFSVHTQSCERAVHEVAQASRAVCGEEKRDGWVRARIDQCELLPVLVLIRTDSLNGF